MSCGGLDGSGDLVVKSPDLTATIISLTSLLGAPSLAHVLTGAMLCASPLSSFYFLRPQVGTNNECLKTT